MLQVNEAVIDSSHCRHGVVGFVRGKILLIFTSDETQNVSWQKVGIDHPWLADL